MARQIAISDIHGCVKTFRKLVLDVVVLTKDDILFLLGDYVNKGPEAKGVIDYIFKLRKDGYQVKCLRGNHEQYLLDGLASRWEEFSFITRGGEETLKSFGVKSISDIPKIYLDFIQSLPFYIELEEYLLIHAGLDFNLTDPYTDNDSMLNIREMTVDLIRTGGRKIIHGHVPATINDIEKSILEGASHISIDSGCVYDKIPTLSHLVALDLDSKKLYIQKNID